MYCSDTVCSSIRVMEAAQYGHVRADIAGTLGLGSTRDIGEPVKIGRLKVINPPLAWVKV